MDTDYDISTITKMAKRYWRETLPRNFKVVFMPEFTVREASMFKHFVKRSAPHTIKALFTGLNHWPEFLAEVKKQDGAFGPTIPSIAFVLKHVQTLVNWSLQFESVQLIAQEAQFVTMVPKGYVHPTKKKYVIDTSVLDNDDGGDDDGHA